MRRQLGIASLLSAAALAWVVAGSAAVLAAPTAITGPVGSVGPTSATVSGTVNPGGQATTWYVEYGTSTSYGSQSASASAGSGSANVAVSRSLSGLAAGTTYHYRVVATNGAGTSRGADGIFTTLSAPAVVTGAATGVSPTAATLNGSVDPNGRATTWYFEYGTSTSYGTRTAVKDAGSGGSAVAVSAALASLARGRVYHYRLVASSDAGTSRGADKTFATYGAPAVTTDAASSVAPTSARLNGTITPNGQSTTWYFDYGTSTSYGTRTAVKGAGSGTGATRVNASLTAAPDRRHVPLSPRRDERIRDDVRPQSDLQHGAAARRPHGGVARRDRDDRDPDRLGRPAHAGDELVVRVRHDDGLRLADDLEERGLGRDGARRQRSGLGPAAGHHLPLPARRPERRRHDARCRSHLHHRRRHADAPGAPGRLRTRDPPLRLRADAARGRDRDGLRTAARRGLAAVGRNRPDRGRRQLALAREAAHPDVVRGAVGGRAERRERRRRPSGGLASPDRERRLLDARLRREVVRGARRAAAAAVGDRTLGHDQAGAPESSAPPSCSGRRCRAGRRGCGSR